MINLNLLFNKIYYADLPSADKLYEHNKKIFDSRFNSATDYCAPFDGVSHFRLETVYPGMILGSGNPHGAHTSDYDIQMGFSFDYVTGQPYIPGSSVKGVLRNCFEKYPDVIKELTGCEELDMKALIQELFEGDDVFLDAVVCRGNTEGRIIGEDYITPHPDPVKNPKLIHIIKVVPDVGIEFRFILYGGKAITADAKLNLYKILLKMFGVGSKTNVGYGILKEYDQNRMSCTASPAGEAKEKHTSQAPSVGTKNEEPTMIICPHCGKKNFKYRRDGNLNVTTQINRNWDKKFCFDCKGKLI